MDSSDQESRKHAVDFLSSAGASPSCTHLRWALHPEPFQQYPTVRVRAHCDARRRLRITEVWNHRRKREKLGVFDYRRESGPIEKRSGTTTVRLLIVPQEPRGFSFSPSTKFTCARAYDPPRGGAGIYRFANPWPELRKRFAVALGKSEARERDRVHDQPSTACAEAGRETHFR